MKKLFIFLSAICISLTAISCSNGQHSIARMKAVRKLARKNIIKIAVTSGKDSEGSLGIQQAVDEINQEDGIKGKKIQLVYFDDEHDLKKGIEVAYAICRQKDIFAVIGHKNSNITKEASLIYHYYGVVQLNPFSTSASLKYLDFLVNIILNDKDSAYKPASFCLNSSYQNILVYSENDNFGNSLANSFEYFANELNLKICDRGSYESYFKTTDFISQGTYWKKNFDFDAVFVSGDDEHVENIIAAFRGIGITQPIISDDTIADESFFRFLKEQNFEDVYYSTDFSVEKCNQDILAKIPEAHRNAVYCHGYDSVYILKSALERTKNFTQNEFYAQFEDALYNDNIFGNISIKERNITNANVYIMRITGGTSVIVDDLEKRAM